MQMTQREAIRETIASALSASPQTVLMGETIRDIGAAGVTETLWERFGPTQVLETPVSENAIFGAALGLALGGGRAIVEIYAADFLLAVANELMNDIAKWTQQQNRPRGLPITVRGCMGANGGLGPEHSQSMEPFFHHATGLTIVVPGDAAEAAGLLKSCLQADFPTLFLEHRRLYDSTAEVHLDAPAIPLGQARIVRPGTDVTIVAWGWMLTEALAAAEQLSQEGISAEVLDPRTIRPFDWDALIESASRTRAVVVVEEAQRTGSVSSEIITRLVEATDARVRLSRVTMPDTIHPYSKELEAPLIPGVADILEAVRRTLSPTSPAST